MIGDPQNVSTVMMWHCLPGKQPWNRIHEVWNISQFDCNRTSDEVSYVEQQLSNTVHELLNIICKWHIYNSKIRCSVHFYPLNPSGCSGIVLPVRGASRLCGTHISETTGRIFSLQIFIKWSRRNVMVDSPFATYTLAHEPKPVGCRVCVTHISESHEFDLWFSR